MKWLVLLLLLASCAAHSEKNEYPAPPPLRVVQVLDDTVEASTAVNILPPSGRNVTGQLRMLGCDAKEQKLVFSITNSGSQTWDLDQTVSLYELAPFVPVRLFLNGYEVNRQLPTYRDGQQLFGPHELFSENCENKYVQPGDTVHCTTYPVPLSSYTNNLWLDVPGVDETVRFQC